MAAKKPKKPDGYLDREALIKEKADLLLPALADLSTFKCPECGSRLLEMRLVSHSAIIVTCRGEGTCYDENNLISRGTGYECLYRFWIRYEPKTAEVITLDIEEHAHSSHD